jgi:hypothetical protein
LLEKIREFDLRLSLDKERLKFDREKHKADIDIKK